MRLSSHWSKRAVDLIGVDEASLLIHRANAVRVAVGGKAGLAVMLQHRDLERTNVGRNRLRLDAGKERIQLGADLDVVDAHARKDAGEHASPRAVHAVDGVFLPGCGDPLEIGEDGDGLDIRAKKVSLGNGAAGSGHRQLSPQITFDRRHDRRAARSAITGFEFHPIPLRRIVAGGDHHSTRRAQMFYRVGESRRGGDAVGDAHWDAGSGGHFGNDLREAL